MKSFKVVCLIDEGNGIEERVIFIKGNTEEEVETMAKYFWLSDEKCEKGITYYGVKINGITGIFQ